MSILCGSVLMLCANVGNEREPIADDFRCLSSTDAKPILLELRLFGDPATNWRGGYVRYGRAKTVIPIALISSEVVAEYEGRSSEFRERWREIVDGDAAGEYDFSYQGANIESFTYLDRAGRKRHSFVQNNDAVIAGGASCAWQ